MSCYKEGIKKEGINIIDKERYYQQIINQYAGAFPIGYEERNALMNILTTTFADVEMTTEKKELSVTSSTNEIIVKNYLGVKQLSGKRPGTLRAYSHAIKFFLDNTGYDLVNTTTNDIRRYLLWYETRGASKVSTDNARRMLNSFFQFMEDEGYIEKNPCKRIPYIKREKLARVFLTDTDIEAMRDACATPRELAIIDFLVSTGVRVSEISNIRLNDVNWLDKSVLIHGKGGKDRYVYFNAKAIKHVQDYLNSREPSEWLFTHEIKPYSNLKTNTINHIITAIGERVGLSNVTVHDFRRWFANDLNRKNIDIRVIQQLLGHENFATTQGYYLQVEDERAKQIHQAFC